MCSKRISLPDPVPSPASGLTMTVCWLLRLTAPMPFRHLPGGISIQWGRLCAGLPPFYTPYSPHCCFLHVF